MNIQDIKSNTTWQEASNTINNNNNKISLAIATLENATLKNKGYFTTVEKLNEAIPNPTIGSKAYVGTSEPYAIYIVENGAWVDSGYTGGDEIVAKITTDRIENGAVTSEKIATSAFDSTLSVSGKIAPADVVGEKITKLNQELNSVGSNVVDIGTYTDLDISDESGNILARFSGGEFQTKKFYTANASQVLNDNSDADLNIGDSQGNILAEFKDGHLRTKNFDSRNGNESSYSLLKGKRVAFIGDSITQGFNATNHSTKRWTKIFCDIMQCIEINLGVGSTYFCSGGSNENNTLREMLGNNIPTCAAFPNGTLRDNRFISRVTTANIGLADLIFVFGGTNDFSTNTKPIGNAFEYEDLVITERIGNKKKIAPTDTDTFSGALHEIIRKIRSINPTAQLVFMTILNRGRYQSGRPVSDECNLNGDFIQDYNETIRTICDFYAIPVVEIGTMLNQDWCNYKSAYTSDSLHPTDLGHKRIGELLAKWVQSNIII